MNDKRNPKIRSGKSPALGNSAWDYSPLECRMVLDGGGGWIVMTDVIQYDDLGRITVQEVTYDVDGNGAADFVTNDQYQYNAQGMVTSYVHEEDHGADGVIDARFSNSQQYSEEGQLLVSHDTWDHDGNGSVDAQVRTTWNYDANGEQTSALTENDLDGDGTYESSFDAGEIFAFGTGSGEWNVLSENTELNGQGLVTFQEFSIDTDGDNVADYRTIDFFEYGADNALTGTVHEVDAGADGTIDSRQTDTFEYDSNGTLIAIHTQIDDNADGEIDSEYSVETGELVNCALTGGLADNGSTPIELPVDAPVGPTMEGPANLVGAWLSIQDGLQPVFPEANSSEPSTTEELLHQSFLQNPRDLGLAGSGSQAAKKSTATERDDVFAALSFRDDSPLVHEDLSLLFDGDGKSNVHFE